MVLAQTGNLELADFSLVCFVTLQFLLWLLVLYSIEYVCSGGQLAEFCERCGSSYTNVVHAVSKNKLIGVSKVAYTS